MPVEGQLSISFLLQIPLVSTAQEAAYFFFAEIPGVTARTGVLGLGVKKRWAHHHCSHHPQTSSTVKCYDSHCQDTRQRKGTLDTRKGNVQQCTLFLSPILVTMSLIFFFHHTSGLQEA